MPRTVCARASGKIAIREFFVVFGEKGLVGGGSSSHRAFVLLSASLIYAKVLDLPKIPLHKTKYFLSIRQILSQYVKTGLSFHQFISRAINLHPPVA